jgi:geranylgeranyl pyrophosphate synthase
MAGGKTASLIRASCHVGAFLAGADSKQQDALCTYGWNIGLAFQIQDDILNLIGDEKKYKKEIGGDIREGKRTLMVIDCLNKMPVKDATKLRGFLGKNGIKHEDVLWCIDQLKTHGSIDYAQAYSKTLCKSAVNSLSIFKDHDSKSDLLSVAKYSVDRQE